MKDSSDRAEPEPRPRWLARLSLPAKLWWGAGLVFALGYALLSNLGSDSCLAVFFFVLMWMWLVPTVLWVFYWLWLKITYRVSVRLFFSYLLIGVLPFPLLLALSAMAGYVSIGQYTSAEFGDVMRGVRTELTRFVGEALDAAEKGGSAAGRDWLGRGLSLSGELRGLQEHVDWIFATPGDVWRNDGATELTIPSWLEDGAVENGPFSADDGPLLVAVARRGEHTAAALVRLTPEVAENLSQGQWYEASFDTANIDDGNITIGDSDEEDDSEEDDEEPDSAMEPGDPRQDDSAASQDTGGPEGFWAGLWGNRWIFFIRLGPEFRRWRDGSTLHDQEFVTILRTSPREAVADLFQGRYKIREVLWGIFLGVFIFFAFVYFAVVGLAGYQIFAITRSTSRLTRGTRHVQSGDLAYRIPVKRRDQLGDLAVAFNSMTESVGSMLDEVAEKERLKGELELAREIQQSLLPGSYLRHGPISVHAFFRPAAEVGGDYFDLFPLERGHLIVAVGDVAGHGLSTGLLMAMVKSAVATLIQEGHRGSALLERVNQFMLQQPREHRMVTLAIADIDTEAGFAEITNAAHPPVFLSGGSVREVMLPALPVGYKWHQPPPSERLELEPGSRLVFYSDGLVEAVGDDDEQFGYERLKAFLETEAETPSEELLAKLLAELERHTGGRPLDDDLTLLVIDCGTS